jgi:uncharacterized membrane protein YdbT with pleckstrin-like domain
VAVDSRRGETIVFEGHPSWLSMTPFLVRWLAISLVVGIGAGIASIVAHRHERTSWVLVAVLAIWLLTFCRGQLRRTRVTYRITNRSLVIERGRFARRRREAELQDIQNVTVRQTMLQRALGIGSIDFETAAEAGHDFRFRGVDDPQRIVRAVDRARDGHSPASDRSLFEFEPPPGGYRGYLT